MPAHPPPPQQDPDTHIAAPVLGRYCATCHMIDGEGSPGAPDLTNIGAKHDAQWLKDWITAPDEVDPAANMPAFGSALTTEQMAVLVRYLARRK